MSGYPKLTSTGLNDKNGKKIFLHDKVRRCKGPDCFEGEVVFVNGGYRILITKGYDGNPVDGTPCLKHNYTLLFCEICVTSDVEKINGN